MSIINYYNKVLSKVVGDKDIDDTSEKKIIEKTLQTHIVARVVAPLFALICAADVLVQHPLTGVALLTCGIITFDIDNILVGAVAFVATPIDIMALGIIGTIGLVSPKTACDISGHSTMAHYVDFPKIVDLECSRIQARIMSLMMILISPIQTLSKKSRKSLVDFSYSISETAMATIAKPLYALYGAATLNATCLSRFGIEIE